MGPVPGLEQVAPGPFSGCPGNQVHLQQEVCIFVTEQVCEFFQDRLDVLELPEQVVEIFSRELG